jgi:hypothetical protein
MQARDKKTPIYQEWQLPNAASFLANLIVFPSIWLVLAPINPTLGWWLAGIGTATSVVVRVWASKMILVTEDYLIVGNAEIPRAVIASVTEITKEDQFAEKGPKLDARAFVALRSLKELVRIEIADSSDPTPYVLISTRRAKELVSALRG